MIHGTKEEHDLYVNQMIVNLAHDEAARNIDVREPFHSQHEVNSFMREEMEEIEEAIAQLREDFEVHWHMCKKDSHYDKKDFKKQLDKICLDCKQVALEALHTYAVAIKTNEQLGGK